MHSLGIDLSTDPSKVWLCEVDWSPPVPRVVALDRATALADPRPERAATGAPVRDEAGLIALLVQRLVAFEPSAGRVVGVDVPFGWPAAFVDAVGDWEAGDLRGFRKRPELRLRACDRFMRAVSGITPMSVSTDRMGSTAMLWAEVLSTYARSHDRPRVDRVHAIDGFAEVYPATALRMWTDEEDPVPAEGYKASLAAREVLVPLLTGITPEAPPFQHPDRGALGIEVPPEFRSALVDTGDALDAFLCALIARSVAIGRCFRVDGPVDAAHVFAKDRSPAGAEARAVAAEHARSLQVEATETAEAEGWIHVPHAGTFAAGLYDAPATIAG